MSTLYYIKTKESKKTLPQLIDKLKYFGLNTQAIEEHYKEHMMIDGEMIMWCTASDYPSWVFRSQEDIVKACGTEIRY